MKKLAVVGAGASGTAVAKLLADKYLASQRNGVYLWVRPEARFKGESLADIIYNERENRLHLPEIKIPYYVKVTSSLADAVKGADVIVSAVPSEFLRQTTESYKKYIKEKVIVVSLTKGLNYDEEMGKFERMSQLLAKILPIPLENIVALSGPNFAFEIAEHKPSATVVAGTSPNVDFVRELFDFAPVLKVYKTGDIIGVELGGALKNIYAIAGGICDYLIEIGKAGKNSRAALFTRCKAEMVRLGEGLGANRATLEGLAGVGDLGLCFSDEKSRNHQVGYLNAKGLNLEESQGHIRGVAEGIRTVRNVYLYAEKNNLDLNIARWIYLRLYQQKPLQECIAALFRQTEVE